MLDNRVIKMPANRLNHLSEPIPACSVIGMYSSPEDNFVRHIGFLTAKTNVKFGDFVDLWHMMPPLVVDEEANEALPTALREWVRCPAHITANTGIDAHSRDAIRDWRADVKTEQRPPEWRLQFTIDPPVKWETDELGRRSYRRFSCVGFVLECFREALDLILLEPPATGLPLINMETLVAIYGTFIRKESAMRQYWGIGDTQPSWPIVLAGYAIHALNRTLDEIRAEPFKPKSIEYAYFPLKRPLIVEV